MFRKNMSMNMMTMATMRIPKMMFTHKEYKIGKQDEIFQNIWYEPIHRAIPLASISVTMQKLNSLYKYVTPNTKYTAIKNFKRINFGRSNFRASKSVDVKSMNYGVCLCLNGAL